MTSELVRPLYTTTRAGLAHAIETTNRAIRDVPAYADYLRAQGNTTTMVGGSAEFEALPATTKADYLRGYEVQDLMWHGDIAGCGTWSSTSGSSGVPTFVPRDEVALDDAVDAHERILRDGFGADTRTTLVIVCFAMGTWIGGTYTYQAMLGLRERGYRLSMVTPGLQVDMAVHTLSALGPRYDHVVLAGYPPSIKDVIDKAPESALDQDIKILLAGEAITESWRDHVLNRIGHPGDTGRVCLIYGTAEAGVMGHETALTTDIRRRAATDAVLSLELFGGNQTRQPTFVRYDPERRYAEVDDDGFLLFTLDSSIPMIRYRINDQGAVFSGADLRSIVNGCGHGDLVDRIDPADGFLVLAGRPDVAEQFYSLNIYAGDLQEAFDADEVIDHVTGRFVIDRKFDGDFNQTLTISVEVAESGQETSALKEALVGRCLDALIANNSEFRTLHGQYGDRTTPRIDFHVHGTGPFVPGAPKNTRVRRAG